MLLAKLHYPVPLGTRDTGRLHHSLEHTTITLTVIYNMSQCLTIVLLPNRGFPVVLYLSTGDVAINGSPPQLGFGTNAPGY